MVFKTTYICVLSSLLCLVSCTRAPTYIDQSGFSVASAPLRQAVVAGATLGIHDINAGRALIELELDATIGKKRLTQVTVFERPDKLRLEFFATKLNHLTALIVSNNQGIFALDTDRSIVYRGQVSVATIERLLTVPFAPEELMLWLVGRFAPPDEQKLLSTKVRVNNLENEAVIDYGLSDGRSLRLLCSILEYSPGEIEELKSKVKAQKVIKR